jgi:hypothetical protein
LKESVDDAFFRHDLLEEELDGHPVIELDMPRCEDHAHGSLPDNSLDTILAEEHATLRDRSIHFRHTFAFSPHPYAEPPPSGPFKSDGSRRNRQTVASAIPGSPGHFFRVGAEWHGLCADDASTTRWTTR